MTTTATIQNSTLELLPDLFERQAAQTPDSIALICAEEQLTYRDLNQRATQLAWHLKKMSVHPETLVGICTSRSLDMVVGILGVLKAGGAYVPLDPSYPKERLAFILADAQAPVVITQSSYSASFSEHSVRMICLDTDRKAIQEHPVDSPAVPIQPENLAYVIYTSGSTGKPKGVMITHYSLTRFVQIAGSVLDVASDDVYLLTASIAYALSVRQLMIPLAQGATVVIATAQEMQDPLSMFQLIKKRNISLMDMVPSFWRACLQRLSDLPVNELKHLMDNSLRRIVSIGEPLLSDLPQEWMSRFGDGVKLVNIFGQTETTGVVATYPIPPGAPAATSIVPVGRSVPDTQLYLLGSDLKPVPLGEQGELCVSSPCLARGYLNRPELTAEKFIPNPFGDGLHDRLYRTGDLARMREDGNIEFIGRGDHQVKIRGQRLELGEVEAVLREHPAVKDCVVTTRGDSPDDKYLAAYILPALNQVPSVRELKDYAHARLPEYMIPSVFLFLEALPLTPNGKLDRLALPDPSTIKNHDNPSNVYEEPRNQIERTIAHIWQDLLKLDRVGIHDDYFALGGHSLMSVRMFARIERELRVRLPYTSLFHATTIAQIAGLVANASEEVTRWNILVPIHPSGDKLPFFGVHAHEGGVLFWRDIVSYLPEDQPFYGLQARGVDGVQQPLKSIPDMAALYVRELRAVQPHGPYYLGGYSMGGEIAFEMAQQLVRTGERVNLLVLFDTRNPKRSLRVKSLDDVGSIVPELGTSVPSSRLSLWKRKIIGHYARGSGLSARKKVAYVLNQISDRLRRLAISIEVKFFKIIGRRLPDSLLLRYLRKEHSEALINYVPEVYSGKVTLFRATETLALNPDDSPLGWRPLASGGLDVYHFDAPHEIIDARYAKEVAAQLDECLRKARNEEAVR